MSLFSKLFSRKRKEKDKDKVLMPPPLPYRVPSPAITPTSSTDTISEGKGDKEYATFSAQFPPPEWVWYQQQLDKHKRIETWVSQQTIDPTQLPKITARPPTGTKSITSTENLPHISKKSSRYGSQLHVDYIPMGAVCGLEEKFLNKQVVKEDSDTFVKPLPVKSENIYDSFSNESSSVKQNHHYYKCQDVERNPYQGCTEYSVIDIGNMTPFNSSNVYQSILTLSPVAHLLDGSTYSKSLYQPKLGPAHSTPLCGGQNDRTAYRVDGHEARDRIYGLPDASHKQRSQRSQRRAHRLYSCHGGPGSDISYEYKGCLPKKNSSHAQSRDSGVNCVGLSTQPDQVKKDHIYENTTNKDQKHHHNVQQQNKRSYKHHLTIRQVNNTAASESSKHIPLSFINTTTNSIAYESNVTNTAYNSVVYGSVNDINGEPSVTCNSIADSHFEPSEMPFPHTSLQSGFYEESNLRLASNSAACVQTNFKTSRDAVESQSSLETVILDVVGSQSEADDDEESDCGQGIFELVNDKETQVKRVFSEDDIRIVEWRSGHQQRAEGGICIDNGDEVCTYDNRECSRRTVDKQEVSNHITTSNADLVSTHRRQKTVNEKNSCVVDSGFSSPMNQATEMAANSKQSISTGEDSSGVNSRESNDELQHCSTTGKHNTQQQTLEICGPHSDSDICMITGTKPQCCSNNDNEYLYNREISKSGEDKHTTFKKPLSKMKLHQPHSSSHNQLHQPHSSSHNQLHQPHSSSHNQLHQPHSSSHNQLHQPHSSSHNQLHQPHSSQHQHTLQFHNPYQNSVSHNQPAAKHMHHQDHVSVVHRDHENALRVPLHPNTVHHLRKPNRANKQQERLYSDHFWKLKTPNEVTYSDGKTQLTKKYGFNEEFEVMGVL